MRFQAFSEAPLCRKSQKAARASRERRGPRAASRGRGGVARWEGPRVGGTRRERPSEGRGTARRRFGPLAFALARPRAERARRAVQAHMAPVRSVPNTQRAGRARRFRGQRQPGGSDGVQPCRFPRAHGGGGRDRGRCGGVRGSLPASGMRAGLPAGGAAHAPAGGVTARKRSRGLPRTATEPQPIRRAILP